MPSEQQIIVRGEAERQVPADVAALSVSVQVDAPDQTSAHERATDLASAAPATLTVAATVEVAFAIER